MSKVRVSNVTEKEKQEKLLSLILFFAGAFIVHIIFAAAYIGFKTDMDCFNFWSSDVFENGFSNFYRPDVFTDYPPGYIYILYIIGAIKKLFGITVLTSGTAVVLKMPAIICDLVISYIIYKVGSKYTIHAYALLFAAAYAFNPAVILNSCTWGQVDSVFTLFVVLMCYFVTEKKLPAAYFVFAAGILIKPQSLIFTPVLIYGIIDQVFLTDFSLQKMFKQLGIGLAAIAVLVLAAVPFGLPNVLKQYVETLGQYEYASVNAYNIWALLGKNWTAQDKVFMFMPYKTWGTIFIVLTVAVSAYYCIRNKENESKYYLSGAFIVTSVFMLAVRMHERYIYPALALLLITAAVKRNYKYVLAFVFLSVVHFMNAYHVLFYYNPETYDFSNPVIYIIAFLSVSAFVYFVYVYCGQLKCKRAYTQAELEEINRNKRTARNKNTNVSKKTANQKNNTTENKKNRIFSIRPSEVTPKWSKWDWIIMLAVTVIYACIAFYNLGDFDAPQTQWSSETTGQEITLDFGKTTHIDHMYAYLGSYENRKFEVQTSEDGNTWTQLDITAEDDGEKYPGAVNIESVFCWNKMELCFDSRYVKFIQKDDKAAIMELMIYGNDDTVILPDNTSDYPQLFDEQDIFDGTKTYMNSTYFDEIYHARTAYEMIHHMYCYENTHPPLGKAIMAIGIIIFGMCPFGWRFMGTLFGVLMIPVMYLIGRKLTGKTWLASVMAILFAFDFMHFAQTRIATIDVYVTMFVMLMYYFMLCYYKMSFNDTPLKKTFIPLLLSGICMGLGCASKWTGVYAGAGLAVVFAAVMVRRYGEYKSALAEPKGKTGKIEHSDVINNYKLYTLKTLAFCLIAFIVIPGIIYLCSYIPFSDGGRHTGLVSRMLANQQSMYNYHSTLESTHAYQSSWYQWPIIQRPILFYLESVTDTLKSGISSMGNPLVWWVGILAFLYMIYLIIRDKDRVALFLFVGYLAQYLPWMLVSRCTFIYHYFPSVPFVVMMIGYSIYRIARDKKAFKIGAGVYVALAVLLFFAFYPVLSGYPVTLEYAKLLKWFDSWVLLF